MRVETKGKHFTNLGSVGPEQKFNTIKRIYFSVHLDKTNVVYKSIYVYGSLYLMHISLEQIHYISCSVSVSEALLCSWSHASLSTAHTHKKKSSLSWQESHAAVFTMKNAWALSLSTFAFSESHLTWHLTAARWQLPLCVETV